MAGEFMEIMGSRTAPGVVAPGEAPAAQGVVVSRVVRAANVALLAFALTLSMGAVGWAQVQVQGGQGTQGTQAVEAEQKAVTDSLYRAARSALNRGAYAEAADLFQKIRVLHPTSAEAADALYWEAFARYRIGGTEQLQAALVRLREQDSMYPAAASRTDARALQSRIQGELARLGDPAAAMAVSETAVVAAKAPDRPRAVVAPEPPRAAVIRPSDVMAVALATGNTIMLDASRQIAAVGRELAAVQRDLSRVQREAALTMRGVARGSAGDTHGLPEECSREEAEIRTAALNALLISDSDRAVPVLRQVLARRDPCSIPLRRTAVLLIAHRVTPETETVLLETAREDPDLHVRKNAVFHLSQVGTERAVGVLQEILRTPTDSALHEQALFALSQHGDERARQLLRDYATRGDAPARLRGMAIFWVGQDASPEGLAFLQKLYRELQDDQLKTRILFSLAQHPDPENTGWLMGVALDGTEPEQVRSMALHHAGTRSDLRIEDLIAVYDRLPDQKLREQLVFTLTQRKEPEAIDKLIDIARREPEPNLRKRAIYWLSQTNDPRVAEVLLEIIGGT